eukprot:TRINITY_DN2476_c0_g1_i4.p3 TRINITY_DN2476_c0_g1~~TRINITY_DN2476_c0_g1_i4.p3  ORF type:complete len:177 (+),score=36.04 TRINITY_DN2476_c0_g1_i4:181-711(+)
MASQYFTACAKFILALSIWCSSRPYQVNGALAASALRDGSGRPQVNGALAASALRDGSGRPQVNGALAATALQNSTPTKSMTLMQVAAGGGSSNDPGGRKVPGRSNAEKRHQAERNKVNTLKRNRVNKYKAKLRKGFDAADIRRRMKQDGSREEADGSLIIMKLPHFRSLSQRAIR